MLHLYFAELARNFCASFRVFKYTTLMRTNRRVLTFCLVIFAPMLTGVSFNAVLSAPPKPAPAKDKAPTFGAVGDEPWFTQPDPKHPGKLLYELKAAGAAAQSDTDGFHGTLTSVWAKLFQNGVASAILTAPRALGGSANKSVVITGLGGVSVKSLTEPGTVLTADKMVWYATLNKIVATGHVYYRNGQNGATMRAPRMVGDTRLKSITLNYGHGKARF